MGMQISPRLYSEVSEEGVVYGATERPGARVSGTGATQGVSGGGGAFTPTSQWWDQRRQSLLSLLHFQALALLRLDEVANDMVKSQPLVSVGIPVYNGERWIQRALESLRGQTYGHLELIISDNASIDATATICQEYVARPPRVRYYRNPTNIGVYANFRRVFDLSSGDYFMWASMDDVRPLTAVAACIEALLKNAHAVMAQGAVLVESEGRAGLVDFQ